ncbi:hypothetical protein ACE6H2_025230 [Prunus campanulata]
MTPSTPSLQGERGSEEKLSLLLLLPMPCIAVDDACYVSALLLMPLLFLPYLLPCSQGFCVLPYLLLCSQGFCVLLFALSSAVFTGLLCSALSTAVLTGLLCSALSVAVLTGFLCSAMCPIF